MFQIKRTTNINRRKPCLPVQRWMLGGNMKLFTCICACIWSLNNDNMFAFKECSVIFRSWSKVIPSMAREKHWRTLQCHTVYDKPTLASQKDNIWAHFSLMRRNNNSQTPVATDATALSQSSATYIQTLSPHSPLPGLRSHHIHCIRKEIKISNMHKNTQRRNRVTEIQIETQR